MNDNKLYERYQRQVILKEFGLEGQQKLLQAKVLVIGAGGLGCPVLQYLVAAGVGTIGIVDDDIVSISNLHRQVLYNVDDIGKSKAAIAKNVLQKANSEIKIIAYNERLTTSNALEMINEFEIIIDGTDNFSSRYMINDACVLLKKLLIFGAVSQWEGQVAVFCGNEGVNYRDLFPQPPKDGEVLNCAEAGVIGVLPGIIGTMMANETIKLITGIGTVLINKMITYNALNNKWYEMQLVPQQDTRLLIPANEIVFKQMNYDALCAVPVLELEITANDFYQYVLKNDTTVIDVRECGETPVVDEFDHLQIPAGFLPENFAKIKTGTVVLFCQSGKRSLQAAKLLSEFYAGKKHIYSLKDGIVTWKNRKIKN
jgi:sulfur-carrier protein adenylyltransferase/sulfurtransferase